MTTDDKAAEGCGPPPSKPEKEHLWLQRLCGAWKTETEMECGGGPPTKSTGTDDTAMFGAFWVQTTIGGAIPGMETPMKGLMTIGYDVTKKKFIGTWIDNMMNFMWRYEGSLDASGNVLTLETEGPSFSTPGALAPYRERIELRGDKEKLFSSSTQDADGKWFTFLRSHGKKSG